jgi:hypothetical protein
MGDEYLRTARGFADRGELARAWRDAAQSKGMQPASPELHAWVATLLARTGREAESHIEAQLARALP